MIRPPPSSPLFPYPPLSRSRPSAPVARGRPRSLQHPAPRSVDDHVDEPPYLARRLTELFAQPWKLSLQRHEGFLHGPPIRDHLRLPRGQAAQRGRQVDLRHHGTPPDANINAAATGAAADPVATSF